MDSEWSASARAMFQTQVWLLLGSWEIPNALLSQRLSNVSVHWNHLNGLSEHRSLGCTFRDKGSMVLSEAQEFASPTRSLLMLISLIWYHLQ